MAQGQELAEGYADEVRDSLTELWLRYDAAVESDDSEAIESVERELDGYPLELVAERGEPFQVVLTVGGPDARVVWWASQGAGMAKLSVHWGTGEASRYSDGVRRLAEYFESYMEGE